MAEGSAGTRTFENEDLREAQFHRVRLNDARLRMVDLSGAWLRSVDLSHASIDAEIDGLTINGVAVAPLIEAELSRRDPARALARDARDPDSLRAAWAAIEAGWAGTYARVDAMPEGTVAVSVDDEWTFVQTLRHLVFATDAWLGAVLRAERPHHPWGLPFTDIPEFVADVAVFGLDDSATPTYAEVREVREERARQVRDYLATVTPEQLAEEVRAPEWDDFAPISALRCLRVVLNEECEHRRFAERDLDVIAAADRPGADPASAGSAAAPH